MASDYKRSHDGFGIHLNPDGSYVFTEGRKPMNLLNHAEGRAIEAAFQRRFGTKRQPIQQIFRPAS